METLLNIIKELLEAQNYAQIPGLGRFYYQEVTARRSKKQNTITPPCRMLVFSDESSKNNQQFIEHFAEHEHCNLFNAATEVSSLVTHIKQALKSRGTYYLDSIGTLIDANNKTCFQPDVADVFWEEMYGLRVLTMEPLATKNSSLPKLHRAAPTHGEQITEESKHNWTIHLNKRKVGYVMGAVATLLVLVCLSIPLTEKYHIGFASLHNIFCSTVVDTFNENSNRNADSSITYEPIVQMPGSETATATSVSTSTSASMDSVAAVDAPVEEVTSGEEDAKNVRYKGIISEEELLAKHKSLVDNGKLPSVKTNTSTGTNPPSAPATKDAAANTAAKKEVKASPKAAEKTSPKASETAAVKKEETASNIDSKSTSKADSKTTPKVDSKATPKVDSKTTPKVAEAKTTEVKNSGEQATSGRYTIVLASAVTEKNADEFIERLKKNGYKDAKKYKKGSMLRVVYSGFASENEARTQLKKLRGNEPFDQAWVYEMK